MLNAMKVTVLTRGGAALVLFCAAFPALADTRFQVRRMTRDDVPVGKGQCDIRLQVDNEVEVALRGDQVSIRTLAGRDPRDDGSECNAPLPTRDVQGFTFEVKDSRGDIRLLSEPSPRNGWAAIVAIRDSAGGEGRYHFRVSWLMTGSDYRREDRPPTRRDEDFDRPRGGPGFSWNNTVNYRGEGRGTANISGAGDLRLGQVSIDIDRAGKVVAWFRVDRGRPLTFSGQVIAQEGGRWKADVMTDDRRLRGPMWISVDGRGQVTSVRAETTDGRDRIQVAWDRR